MSGTLYTIENKTRPILSEALVKHFNLDIKVAQFDEAAAADFPRKLVPAYKGADGFKLTESIAVNLYLVSLVKDTTLLGKTKEDYYSIVQWMSFFNSHILPNAASVFRPLLGADPYNKKNVETAQASLETQLSFVESHLIKNTYLVGERLSLADLYSASLMIRAFKLLFGAELRGKFPAVTRWWTTVTNSAVFGGDYTNFEFIAEPIKYTPPAKEEKPKAAKKEAKKEAKPKAAAEDDEEDDTPKEKKAPHPLAALGPAKLPIDNWKRVYSNEDTREKALPWFWENYDPSEWSLWKVAYKYNDELTLTFMSNNLVGGFFNRLSASTKFLFGCSVVYGENNNNGIVGVFLVRGQEFAPAFDVAPDWESYDYTKLDATNPADKALVEDLWAWDKPLDINGEKREIADGKVFK